MRWRIPGKGGAKASIGRLGLIAQSLAVPFLLWLNAAHAQPAATAPARLSFSELPLQFFMAKGAADSCGPGCQQWIVAEGRFALGSAARFKSFLDQLSGRKFPVIFQSSGGIQSEALAIGSLLRLHGLTASVGRTVADDCGRMQGSSAGFPGSGR